MTRACIYTQTHTHIPRDEISNITTIKGIEMEVGVPHKELVMRTTGWYRMGLECSLPDKIESET